MIATWACRSWRPVPAAFRLKTSYRLGAEAVGEAGVTAEGTFPGHTALLAGVASAWPKNLSSVR